MRVCVKCWVDSLVLAREMVHHQHPSITPNSCCFMPGKSPTVLGLSSASITCKVGKRSSSLSCFYILCSRLQIPLETLPLEMLPTLWVE